MKSTKMLFGLLLALLLIHSAVAVDYTKQEYAITLLAVRSGSSYTLTPLNVTVSALSGRAPPFAGNLSLKLQQGDSVLTTLNFGLPKVRYGEATGMEPQLFFPANKTVELSVPYNPTADKIVINDVLGTKTYLLGDFVCARDGVCAPSENSVTCAADCVQGQTGVCILDGSCNGQCRDQDPDCATTPVVVTTPVEPAKEESNLMRFVIIGVGILVVVLLIVFLRWYRNRGQQSEPTYEAPREFS
jgi:hypothetical protein